jgi:molecular chaperone DnaK (HSP70)
MDPPPYSKNANPPGQSDTADNLIIAIDFGTTFTGVAFAHVGDAAYAVMSSGGMKRVAEKVTIVRSWPNQSVGTFFQKTPSCLSYNDPRRPDWGASVQSNDKGKVANFKLGLQENVKNFYQSVDNTQTSSVLGGFLTDHNWKHPELPNKTAVDFTADYLTEMYRHVRTTSLPLSYGNKYLSKQQMTFVLTVPAIWSDKAKELTIQAATRAGIQKENLVLMTEPEAAAIYCATLCAETDLREGDIFLVCDAGGGTVVTLRTAWH